MVIVKKVGVKLSSLIESRLLLVCRQPKQDLQGAFQDSRGRNMLNE